MISMLWATINPVNRIFTSKHNNNLIQTVISMFRKIIMIWHKMKRRRINKRMRRINKWMMLNFNTIRTIKQYNNKRKSKINKMMPLSKPKMTNSQLILVLSAFKFNKQSLSS